MNYMKFIFLTMVTVILTACSQPAQWNEEPSGPPRSQDEITYLEVGYFPGESNPEDFSDFTVEYSSYLSKKIEEYEKEHTLEKAWRLAELDAHEMFLDKNLYSEAKLSYIENARDIFGNSLVKLTGTIKEAYFAEADKEFDSQLDYIIFTDDSTDKEYLVSNPYRLKSFDSEKVREYKINETEKLGLVYKGDEVNVYAYLFLPNEEAVFIDSKMIELSE